MASDMVITAVERHGVVRQETAFGAHGYREFAPVAG